MNWNDLKVFLAIADAGTLAGAAVALRHNHSTIFRRLNALEDSLNTRVFDRLPSGYVLTPVGERLFELARQADDSVQAIERELAGRDLAPSGIVRLTTAPNIARTIVPNAIKALRNTHPKIIVETSCGDSDYDLNRREADIALRATGKPPEHLIGRKVMQLDWWVCSSTSSRRREPTRPDQLQGEPLIGADVSLSRLKAFQWLESNFGQWVVTRANDLSTMASLAKAGIGLATLPSDQNDDGLRRLFKIPDTTGELWLLTHPDLRNVRRIKAVWDALADAANVFQRANLRG